MVLCKFHIKTNTYEENPCTCPQGWLSQQDRDSVGKDVMSSCDLCLKQ